MNGQETVQPVDNIALKLAVENLLLAPKVCRKHLHNWRKRYFNSKGIFKTKGVDWSSSYVEHNRCGICLKKFKTALGFHRHYPKCVEENNDT